MWDIQEQEYRKKGKKSCKTCRKLLRTLVLFRRQVFFIIRDVIALLLEYWQSIALISSIVDFQVMTELGSPLEAIINSIQWFSLEIETLLSYLSIELRCLIS